MARTLPGRIEDSAGDFALSDSTQSQSDTGPSETPLDTGDDAVCDREPIRFSGAIQPHGVLLVIGASAGVILCASRNAGDALAGGQSVLGRTLSDLLDSESLAVLEALNRDVGTSPAYAGLLNFRGHGRWQAMVHRNPGDAATWIVELQPASRSAPLSFGALPALLRSSADGLSSADSVESAWQWSAEQVRRLSKFDRVMVYRFEPDWSGQVVAESNTDGLESWMGLRYPASDIPAQARAMYVRSRMRLIADVNYEPVPIDSSTVADSTNPLDLTFAVLRSVSPVHLEYLKNMGVAASMSVSIVRDGVLWGMILCHHGTKRELSFETLVACEVVAEVLALKLPAKEREREAEQLRQARVVHPRLLQRMADATDFVAGLVDAVDDLLRLARATGAAVMLREKVRCVGVAPDEAQVTALVDWLNENRQQDIFATDSLPKEYPPAAEFKDRACGLLAATISRAEKGYLLFFRPEVFRTLNWAGDPQKPSEFTAVGRVVRPRKTFEVWKQTLREHAEPWQPADVDVVAELRNSVVGIVLRQAETRAKLTAELQQSNRELEAFSYSVSHDLRAPFRHIVGFSDLLMKRNENLDETSQRYVRTIADSAKFAGTLVDGLLSFSRLGRSSLRVVQVDMNDLAAAVWREVNSETDAPVARWVSGPLPTVYGDGLMLRQVLRNLLSNAVKYSHKREQAVVEIGSQPYAETPESASPDIAAFQPVTFFVRDNGVGFDPKYKDKLFGVFQRLHRADEFEGTGIGLANVRRIIERHGGRAWGESLPGAGATFYFTLPRDRPVEPPKHVS